MATLAVLSLIFCYGVVHLFLLRFETGDIYTPYSSLRSDPLGTRALFESLAQLAALSVRRNFRPLKEFRAAEDTTYLYLGAKPRNWEYVDEDFLKPLETLATTGGRLVLSFLPVAKQPDGPDPSPSKSAAPDPKTPETEPTGDAKNKSEAKRESNNSAAGSNNGSGKKGEKQPHQRAENGCQCTPLQDRWGVGFGYQSAQSAKAGEAINVFRRKNGMRFSPVAWRTLLFFENLQPPWKTIYTLDGRPVIIQRTLGRGSIVLTADSFFLSNEGLRTHRNPELLTWLIGPNSKVVFDEFHFGIMKTKGITALIRTYRLHWFFLGIAFLAVLVAWKNSTHFIPPPKQTLPYYETTLAAERDYTHGLISLLRRNIATKDILTVCVDEWKKAAGRAERVTPNKVMRIEAVINRQKSRSNKDTDPVVGYQKICSILAEGKKHAQQPGNPQGSLATDQTRSGKGHHRT